jgi:beta-fructofuranosidase
MSINRNLAGIGDRGIYAANVPLNQEKIVKLHIYRNRSSMEVFANDGQATASIRFYPHWQKFLFKMN